MTIKVPIAKITSPLNNTQCSAPSRGLNNNGPMNNSPAFCGAPIEIKSKRALNLINWFSVKMKAADNRLIMGVTALMSQPFFDIFNSKVDNETRSYSCARTLAKIIAGTTVGVGVREVCRVSTENFCIVDPKKEQYKWIAKRLPNSRKWLAPKNIELMSEKQIKNYTKAFGTYMAIIIMIGTNFAFDAPLTKFLTNVFKKKFKQAGAFSSDKKTSVEGGQK